MAAPLIAVDAMGGDAAPSPEVAGALLAAQKGHQVVLVGDVARLRPELARLGGDQRNLSLHPASEIISMHDHPGQAVRKKRDSSMRVAFDLVAKGQAQAVVSCGNSGAMLACGLLVLGRLPGVERPAIIVTFPTLPRGDGGLGQCALLDMGANVECKPSTLAQFAVLGATFARLGHDKPRPRVGLLANGEEQSKGTRLLRQADELLRKGAVGGGSEDGKVACDFDYAGFVEGRDIFGLSLGRAQVDVVVTDGFTGNVVLKSAEGVAHFLGELLKRQIGRSLRSRLGALLMWPALRALKDTIDIERRGGALLLGVDGVVVICHGRSSPRAIAHAVDLAARHVTSQIAPAVAAAVQHHQPLWAKAEGGP